MTFSSVSSVYSCERLEQEKEELRAAFDGVLQKVQEQHILDLADLEERLKTFYSTEWEKVHQTYQDEANKCKAQMEQQVWRTVDLFCHDTLSVESSSFQMSSKNLENDIFMILSHNYAK